MHIYYNILLIILRLDKKGDARVSGRLRRVPFGKGCGDQVPGAVQRVFSQSS